MLVAVDSWCSMCPYCPRAMLGGSNGVENARRIDRLRAESGRACAFLGVVEKNVHMKMQIIFCSRGELC